MQNIKVDTNSSNKAIYILN